jgi:hypothetical protein
VGSLTQCFFAAYATDVRSVLRRIAHLLFAETTFAHGLLSGWEPTSWISMSRRSREGDHCQRVGHGDMQLPRWRVIGELLATNVDRKLWTTRAVRASAPQRIANDLWPTESGYQDGQCESVRAAAPHTDCRRSSRNVECQLVFKADFGGALRDGQLEQLNVGTADGVAQPNASPGPGPTLSTSRCRSTQLVAIRKADIVGWRHRLSSEHAEVGALRHGLCGGLSLFGDA